MGLHEKEQILHRIISVYGDCRELGSEGDALSQLRVMVDTLHGILEQASELKHSSASLYGYAETLIPLIAKQLEEFEEAWCDKCYLFSHLPPSDIVVMADNMSCRNYRSVDYTLSECDGKWYARTDKYSFYCTGDTASAAEYSFKREVDDKFAAGEMND